MECIMFVKRHESRRQTVWNRKGSRGIGEGDTKTYYMGIV
jgi:hypothetical protein